MEKEQRVNNTEAERKQVLDERIENFRQHSYDAMLIEAKAIGDELLKLEATNKDWHADALQKFVEQRRRAVADFAREMRVSLSQF